MAHWFGLGSPTSPHGRDIDLSPKTPAPAAKSPTRMPTPKTLSTPTNLSRSLGQAAAGLQALRSRGLLGSRSPSKR